MKLVMKSMLRGLCLNDLYDYVKHVKVCDVMKEGLRMYRTKFKWNDAYVKGLITCTHKLTLKRMYDAMIGWRMNALREVRCGINYLSLSYSLKC